MAENRYELNKQLAQMLKGGVIMDVTTPEQAKIAEAAGACAVMALERIPADIRAAGGVSRMSDPKMIRGIQEAVSVPVMAKCRIGHFVEAPDSEAIGLIISMSGRYPADDGGTILTRHSSRFRLSAVQRPGRGAAPIEKVLMIRVPGRAGNGDVNTGSPPLVRCGEFGDPPFRTCVRMSFTRQQNS